MENALGFYRRSTILQEMSISDQRKACQKKAEELGCIITREFIPAKGYASGLSIERDETFLEMVRFIENKTHGFKYLFIYDVSRFGRIPPKSKFYWEVHFKRCGVQIIYAAEHFQNDGSFGDEIRQFVSHSEAHQYSIRLSMSTIRGCRSYAQLGFSCGGRAPYGYSRLLVDQSGTPVRTLKSGEHKADKLQHVVWAIGNPKEVEIVLWIFESFARGMSLIAIVNDLNKRQIPSPYGKAWGKCSIRALLQNRSYIGSRVYFRHNYHDRTPGPKKWLRPQEDWIEKKDAHQPIISNDIFERVQARFKPGKPRVPGHFDSPHLLSGMIHCSHCGYKYSGQYRHHEGKKTPYYDCGGYHLKGRHVCKSFSIKSSLLDDFASQQILKKISKLKNWQKIQDALICALKHLPAEDTPSRLEDLEKAITETERHLGNILSAIRERKSSEALFQELDHLEEEKKQLMSQYNAIKNQIPKKSIDIETAGKEMIEYIKDIPNIFYTGTLTDRRTAIRYFIKKIDILPGTREARFSFYKIPALKEGIVPEIDRNDSFQRVRCGGWI